MSNVYTPIDPSYKLVFDDEFNGTSLDTTKWMTGSSETSNGISNPINPAEIADYSIGQVNVSGNNLSLNAIQTTSTAPNGLAYYYQTGAVHTGYDLTYGYFEARIYLPSSASGNIANWPAFWLVGSSLSGGEIDIMEGLSGQATSTYHQVAGGTPLYMQADSNNMTGWQNYGVLWKPGELDFYYNGQLQHVVTSGVSSAAMAMVLDYALGGGGGLISAPAGMKVDYVHVYQSSQYDPNALAVTPEAGYGGPGDTDSGSTGSGSSGSGSTTPNTLTLRMSEDFYKGNAQLAVSVDGKPVGGALTVSALHSTGGSNVFVFVGNWGQGAHQVKIQFLNDAYGGSTTLDRNLYVNSIAYDGTTYANTAETQMTAGARNITVGGGTPVAVASHDTLTLHLSEDAWKGDANFVLTIDGEAITTAQPITASHAAKEWQDVLISGNFGAGAHDVGLRFVNDAWGGTPSSDRNMYVNGVDFDGAHYGSGTTTLDTNGTAHFSV